MQLHRVALLVFVTISAATVGAATYARLSPGAVALLKPLMQLRNRQATDEFTPDGRWRAPSPVASEVERRIYAILKNRTPAGDEAVAYLVTVYMGEHFGEEIYCEAVNRGKTILPLVRAFRANQPAVGAEPLHKFVRGESYFGGDVVASLRKGERCELDEL